MKFKFRGAGNSPDKNLPGSFPRPYTGSASGRPGRPANIRPGSTRFSAGRGVTLSLTMSKEEETSARAVTDGTQTPTDRRFALLLSILGIALLLAFLAGLYLLAKPP